VIHVSRSHFESLVRRAVRGLPPEFLNRLNNVDIVVERRPSARRLMQAHAGRHSLLLGLYHGVPQTRRGIGYTYALPDRIFIFQESIEQICDSEEQLVAQVRATVVHEIAHHFGIGDERLSELGLG
jgi:predicted Zn-dependent protease with MMP-like domain